MMEDASPYLVLQGDWNEVLREDDGQAWVTCKIAGQPGIQGDLRFSGISSNGCPSVSVSERFRVGTITRKSIEISHEDPTCKCKFFAPQASFKNIHLKSIICMDVTSGGLGVSSCTDSKLLVWHTKDGLIRVSPAVRAKENIGHIATSIYQDRQLTGHLGDVYTCKFFPSGVVVLSGGADMMLKIWSAETGQCPVTLKGHRGAILDTTFVDRGRNILSVSRDGTAKLWDCGQALCLATVTREDDTINCCDIQAAYDGLNLGMPEEIPHERETGTEGKIIITGSENGNLKGTALHSRKEIFNFSCSSAVNCCTFISSEKVVCGTQNGLTYLLDLRNSRSAVKKWLNSASPVLSLLTYQDGFFSNKNDGLCFFYSVDGDKCLQLTGSDCDPLYKIVSDGTFLYTCCRDGIIRKYNID